MTGYDTVYRAVPYKSHGKGCPNRSHRTWAAIGRCIWPRAIWVQGSGAWASVAYCRATTVMLHETESDARQSLQVIDRFGCSGRCTRRHQLVRLALADIDNARRIA